MGAMAEAGGIRAGARCGFNELTILKIHIMKNGLHFNPLLFKMVVLVTCFMLVMLYNKSKGADTAGKKPVVYHTLAKR